MMERDFIAQKTKEYHIRKYLESKLSNVGLSQIKLKKIPLGEKIIIYTSRPSLVVGSKGANIKDLTRYLKKEFKLENPQIEINEIKNIFLDANVVAEKIASYLERFGSARFKSIGHRMMENVMASGALGVEIIISGKIPGARAKSWRFYQGYLKKCGDISISGVRKAQKIAALKSGVIGIKVSIMPSDVHLPDKIRLMEKPIEVVEEITEEKESGKEEEAATKEEPEGKSEEKNKKEEGPEQKDIKEKKEDKEDKEKNQAEEEAKESEKTEEQ
jgi:small subunit ribosomal protein S3